MNTNSLDILEKAELPPSQAHAILKAMELEMTAAQGILATKVEIYALRTEVLVRLAEVEGKLSRWVLTCILGQTVVLAGLVSFLAAHLQK